VYVYSRGQEVREMALGDFPYPTTVRELPVVKYPLVGAWGSQKISSKAGPHGALPGKSR
jgi:hypothetical protein